MPLPPSRWESNPKHFKFGLWLLKTVPQEEFTDNVSLNEYNIGFTVQMKHEARSEDVGSVLMSSRWRGEHRQHSGSLKMGPTRDN